MELFYPQEDRICQLVYLELTDPAVAPRDGPQLEALPDIAKEGMCLDPLNSCLHL